MSGPVHPPSNPNPNPPPPPPQPAEAPNMTLRQAMARMEGWYAEGDNRPKRNNNPGDLDFCKETVDAGASCGDPRFAVFETPEAGWEAFRRWLSVPARFNDAGELIGGYMGATLKQVINRFAPPEENQTSNYLSSVCAFADLTPDTIVTQELINA